jgi:hypothetical protein
MGAFFAIALLFSVGLPIALGLIGSAVGLALRA